MFIDGTAVRRFECWGGTVVALFSRSYFSFPWPKTDSIHVMYLVLLMVGCYEEMDWPMQYTQSVAIAWAWFERLIRRSPHLLRYIRCTTFVWPKRTVSKGCKLCARHFDRTPIRHQTSLIFISTKLLLFRFRFSIKWHQNEVWPLPVSRQFGPTIRAVCFSRALEYIDSIGNNILFSRRPLPPNPRPGCIRKMLVSVRDTFPLLPRRSRNR